MSIRCPLIAGLLLATLATGARSQSPSAPPLSWLQETEPGSPVVRVAAPPPSGLLVAEQKKLSPMGLDLSFLDTGDPVTQPDPTAVGATCPRTWGIAGLNAYAVGSKMAPNGQAYSPLFSLDVLLNIALTQNRELYIFGLARFWGQKAAPGVTNSSQGGFDFSKRQYDLDGGLAWNYSGRFEARAGAYSYNNLNRGVSLTYPFGYNDGFYLENRYYFASTNFDKGLYRFVGIGYYPTKDMVGANGQTFKPGLYLNASLAYDILPERLYLFSELQFITMRPIEAKLLLANLGVAFRPFVRTPDLEFRIGADNNVDLQLGFTRTLFYGNVRIVW